MSLINLETAATEGLDGLHVDLLKEETEHAMGAVARAAFHLKTKMRENLSGPGSGVVRKVGPDEGGGVFRVGSGGGAFRTHQASKPGEFPAKFRGELAASIRYDDVRAVERGRFVEVFTNLMPSGSKKHGLRPNASARILEFGGFVVSNLPRSKGRKVKVAARPFIRMTVEQERARTLALLDT